MNSPNEIIIDEKTSKLLNLAASATRDNLHDIVKLLGVDYESFSAFIAEIGYEQHPDALTIITLLKNQSSQGSQVIHIDSNIQEIQNDFDFLFDKELKSAKKTFALIIGANSYVSDSFTTLEFIKRDTEAISNFLTHTFHNVSVDLLTDSQATSENIKTHLDMLSRNVTKNDSVLIYFACHAWTEKIDDVRFNYLCTHDTVFERMMETSITFDEFRGLTSNILASKMLLVLDSCLPKNVLASRKRDAWEELGVAYQSLLSRPGEALIAINRSARTQTVVEETFEHRKMYTSYFLDALESGRKDIVRIRTLYYYMKKSLEEEQVDEGEDDLILLQYESENEDFPIFER